MSNIFENPVLVDVGAEIRIDQAGQQTWGQSPKSLQDFKVAYQPPFNSGDANCLKVPTCSVETGGSITLSPNSFPTGKVLSAIVDAMKQAGEAFPVWPLPNPATEITERLDNYRDVARFVCFHKGFGSGEERQAIESFLRNEESNGRSLDDICRSLNAELNDVDTRGNWYFDGGQHRHLMDEISFNEIAFVHDRANTWPGPFGDKDQVVDKIAFPDD